MHIARSSCIPTLVLTFFFFYNLYDNECSNTQGKTDAFAIDLCLYFCIQWWITWSCHVQALRCFREAFPNHATHLDSYPLIERALFTKYPINTEHFILCFSGFFFHIMSSFRLLFYRFQNLVLQAHCCWWDLKFDLRFVCPYLFFILHYQFCAWFCWLSVLRFCSRALVKTQHSYFKFSIWE